MSKRVVFAGAGAGIGLVVLSLFGVAGVLGFVGVIAGLTTGQISPDASTIGLVAAFAVVVGLWCFAIARDLQRAFTIERADDGTWSLRGAFGRRLGSIAPTAPRELAVREQQVWIFVGTARKYRRDWLEIRSGGRLWKTAMSPVGERRGGYEAVLAWPESGAH